MKRKFRNIGVAAVLTFALMFSFVLPCSAAQKVEVINEGNQLIVEINGEQINCDPQPYIANGCTMVPISVIAKQLGATVDWDSTTMTVTIKGEKLIVLTIGSATATIDGSPLRLQVPATITGGRTMVPLRFVSEALGTEVSYAPPPVETVQPVSPGGLLPREDKIQEELTQEDITRLRSYTVVGEKVQQDINSYPADIQAKCGRHFDTFNQSRKPSILQSSSIFEEISNYDYMVLESTREEFANKLYSITGKGDSAISVVNGYIDDIIKCQVINKSYVLSSQNLIYQASPKYTAIRVKYIFYQSSGSKMQEEGSTLGKWYWRDIELYFVTPLGTREGNITGVIYSGFTNLSDPQPYFAD